MLSWSKRLYVVVGFAVLLGCASPGGSGGAVQGSAMSQRSGMKMAGSSCMTQLENERKQCEQKCPTATGNEHFSVQHKLAMENTVCKESCAESLAERTAQCKSAR